MDQRVKESTKIHTENTQGVILVLQKFCITKISPLKSKLTKLVIHLFIIKLLYNLMCAWA